MTGPDLGGPLAADFEDAGACTLLDADEPLPFELFNPGGSANALLVCDHASRRLPRRLGLLGLRSEQLKEHIAWDPGAAAVARGLAEALDAPLILGGYSRLVIDLNRPLASPELMPAQSDGVRIAGNERVGRTERAVRVAELFQPYHDAIAQWLDQHPDPALRLLSMHSFTPRLGDDWRPWDIGVAYGRDPRLANQLRPILQRDSALIVGDNQPYAVEDLYDFTLPTHGETRGIPHAMIEIRQDGLRTPAQIAAWIARLADAYACMGDL